MSAVTQRHVVIEILADFAGVKHTVTASKDSVQAAVVRGSSGLLTKRGMRI